MSSKLANLPRFAKSLFAVIVGMSGFWLGYTILAKIYSAMQNPLVVFALFAMGIILFFRVNVRKAYYDDFLNGQFSLFAKAYLWCLIEGFSLAYVIIPFGAIIAILMSLLAVQ